MGSYRKPSRIRLTHLLSTAAGTALAGIAAAACLAPQALADPLPGHGTAQPAAAGQHAAVTDAASSTDLSLAKLLWIVKRITGDQPVQAPAVSYTVRPGDSLSAIAGRFYHKPSAWPVLYWANHSKIRWANMLSVGQVLRIPAEPAKIPSAPGLLGPGASATAVSAPAVSAAGYAPAPAQATAVVASGYSGGTPGGSFGQCVVARESGGNAQVMNSSGHYGLYQFSQATWVAYGGSAASFGNASAAQQNQVFANALARGGQSNWSAYDGC